MSGATKGISLERRGSENLRIKWPKNIGAVGERDAISITLLFSLIQSAVYNLKNSAQCQHSIRLKRSLSINK